MDGNNKGIKKSDYNWVEQNCPICNVSPTKYLGLRGGKAHREGLGIECEIWACQKCSLLFPNPMPIPIGGFNQHYAMDADDYFKNHEIESRNIDSDKLVKEAEELLGKTGKLLDIGVGRGEIVSAAKKNGWDVVGIEPSDSFADYVEEKLKIEMFRQPIENCNFPDEEFDVIILKSVLEHLYNPAETIAEIARTLKPKGLFYLDVPNERGLIFKVGNSYQKLRGRDWCINLSPTFPPFHIFGFSPKALQKMLKKNNLKIKSWVVYGGTNVLPETNSISGKIESNAMKALTTVSNLGKMGAYIEAWIEKS